MAEPLHLDIIIANTSYFRSIPEMWEMWIRRELDQYAQELDFQYNFTLGPDP